MTKKRLILFVGSAVTVACLFAAVGCRKVGTDAKSDRDGAWAQATDILARVTPPVFPEKDFNVTEHGAVADGTTDCREAILAAVSACTLAGGGRVVVPAGTYLVNGSLYFESNVNLHLAEGAHIKFGTKVDDYYPLALTRWEGTRLYNYCAFIYAYRKHNVAITGAGTLDGQAAGTWDAWKEKEQVGIEAAMKANTEGTEVVDRYLGEKHFLRPSMIEFLGCDGVLVEGVKIVDSPYWCVHPIFSKNVTIARVRFDSHNPDNNAVAVDSCQDMHITDTVFDNTGAGVAIVSGSGREGRELSRPSRDVYVHGCTFKNDVAIVVGSELGGGVYNILAEGCTVQAPADRAFVVQGISTGGGEVAHVRFRDMTVPEGKDATIDLAVKSSDEAPYCHDIRYADAPVGSEPSAANAGPDVYAGGDQHAEAAGGVVELVGVVKGGPAGASLAYKWSVIHGDAATVTIAEPTALKTSATFAKEGVFVLKLEASDGKATGYHFMLVTVGDQEDAITTVPKPIFKRP